MPVDAFSPPVPPGPPPRKRNDDAGSIPTPPGSHHHPPPLPMHPPPPTTTGAESTHGGEQIFLGEAWMGDGRRGALIFHPQSHPQAHQAQQAHLPLPTQWNPGLHPHPPLVPAYGVNTQLPANYHPYVPVRQSPSPATSARSGMSGGGNGNNNNNAGARVPRPSTSADSGSVRSGDGGGGARSVGNGVPTKRAFVVLDKSVTQAQLQSAFRGRCEGVESVELKVELESGRSRGFAYVTFETHSAMSSACELLNGTELPEGGGTRCKVMPAEDKTYGGSGNSNKRRGSNTPVTSSGGTDRSALTKLSPIAHTSDSAETDTRGGNPDQGLTPSPDSEFEVKKKVSHKKASQKKEDPQRDPKDDGTLRRQREEGDDDDVLSGQLPGPRKYSRLNSPSAGSPNGGESDDGDEDVDTEDGETEDGPEAASRPRRVKSTTTNRRTKAEEEATDAAMALGKVTLGVVAEEDPFEDTEENAEENKEEHEAVEADDDEGPEDTEEPKDKKFAGSNTDTKPSECDDESAVETTAITTAITTASTLFFRLALQLPSYALRHVLASHGPLVDLAMSVDGASGTVRYVDEDGASAALEALHATEILGIELRMSRRESELGVSKGTGTTNADQRKKRTRRA